MKQVTQVIRNSINYSFQKSFLKKSVKVLFTFSQILWSLLIFQQEIALNTL